MLYISQPQHMALCPPTHTSQKVACARPVCHLFLLKPWQLLQLLKRHHLHRSQQRTTPYSKTTSLLRGLCKEATHSHGIHLKRRCRTAISLTAMSRKRRKCRLQNGCLRVETLCAKFSRPVLERLGGDDKSRFDKNEPVIGKFITCTIIISLRQHLRSKVQNPFKGL